MGVEPSVRAWTSADGGVTWHDGAETGTPVQAVAVDATDGSTARIAVVTTEAVLVSGDGGRSFEVALGR